MLITRTSKRISNPHDIDPDIGYTHKFADEEPEDKLLLITLKNVDDVQSIQSTDSFTIYANEIDSLKKMDIEIKRKALSNLAKKLTKKTITVQSLLNKDKNIINKRYISIISSIKFMEKDAYIKINFTREIIGYLPDIKSHLISNFNEKTNASSLPIDKKNKTFAEQINYGASAETTDEEFQRRKITNRKKYEEWMKKRNG